MKISELTKSNVAHLACARCRQTRYALQFQWRVIAEQDLGRVLDSSPPCVDKLLQEDLAEDAVRLFTEDCAEDDRNSVVTGLDVDGFLLTVMNCPDFTTFLDTLWCTLRGVLARLFVESCVLVESLFEGGSHGVPLEQAYPPD